MFLPLPFHSPKHPLKSNRSNSCLTSQVVGHTERSWLRHYATSREVMGSSPDEVDFFNLPNPSSRTMALGPTQPLTEMSTRKSSWVAKA
jgi:hypothetical protein